MFGKDVQIRVLLDGGVESAGIRHYPPGGSLSGAVEVVPGEDVRCGHLWVRLEWHTEGRGDRDQGKVMEQDVYQGDLRAGTPVTFPFAFSLPDAPWSYAGHYVNIVWGIAVDVDVPWSRNPRYTQPFVMAPLEGAQPGPAREERFDLWLSGVQNAAAWPRLVEVLLRVAPDSGEMVRRIASDPGGPGVRILAGLSREAAEAARTSLEVAGAQVEVRPS